MKKHDIQRLLKLMEPKIKKELSNTSYQEQEDLQQELHLKIIEAITKNTFKDPDSFWELKEKCSQDES